MSFIVHDIETIPTSGYKWYVIFVEGPFADEISKEINAHFLTFGREAGRNVAAVRGYDPTEFRKSAYEAPAFFDKKWRERAQFPALLVMNCPPREALADPENLTKGKVMIFPLEDVYQQHKSITGFLTRLLEALKQEDALKALETLDGDKLQKAWGWLSKYFKMEPGFFGFSVKLDKAIRDVLARNKGSFPAG